jgi:D-alanyl-D-alanine carboxypeptidase/D-alanyl-D-alanine-endopeptidase (penicillin-binding protein 4)
MLLLVRPLITARDKAKKEQKKEATVSENNPAATPINSQFIDLARRVDSAIAESEFSYARWGISVIRINDGSSLYQRNADQLFTPASNMKIYTTGVALDLLGADYRWRTSVYAGAQPDANGRVQGISSSTDVVLPISSRVAKTKAVDRLQNSRTIFMRAVSGMLAAM